jgi:hypothetical protein
MKCDWHGNKYAYATQQWLGSERQTALWGPPWETAFLCHHSMCKNISSENYAILYHGLRTSTIVFSFSTD